MDEALRRIEAESIWLNPWVGKHDALALLQPFAADLMAAIPASTRANSTRNYTRTTKGQGRPPNSADPHPPTPESQFVRLSAAHHATQRVV